MGQTDALMCTVDISYFASSFVPTAQTQPTPKAAQQPGEPERAGPACQEHRRSRCCLRCSSRALQGQEIGLVMSRWWADIARQEANAAAPTAPACYPVVSVKLWRRRGQPAGRPISARLPRSVQRTNIPSSLGAPDRAPIRLQERAAAMLAWHNLQPPETGSADRQAGPAANLRAFKSVM